jgi:hypothetical protein
MKKNNNDELNDALEQEYKNIHNLMSTYVSKEIRAITQDKLYDKSKVIEKLLELNPTEETLINTYKQGLIGEDFETCDILKEIANIRGIILPE